MTRTWYLHIFLILIHSCSSNLLDYGGFILAVILDNGGFIFAVILFRYLSRNFLPSAPPPLGGWGGGCDVPGCSVTPPKYISIYCIVLYIYIRLVPGSQFQSYRRVAWWPLYMTIHRIFD